MKKIILMIAVMLLTFISVSAHAVQAWPILALGSEKEVYYQDGGTSGDDTIIFYAYYEPAGWYGSPWESQANWDKTSKKLIVYKNGNSVVPPVLETKKAVQCEKNATDMYIVCQAQMKNYFNGEEGVWNTYSKAVVALELQINNDASKVYKTEYVPLSEVLFIDDSEIIDDPADDAAADVGSDTDGDKIDDSKDDCPALYNPSQVDHDGDGIGDYCDNCMFVANADQADGDDDGFGDACILDSDGDGIKDKDDNCPTVANPDQANADRDFYGDACERTSPPAGVSSEPAKVTPLYDDGCSLVMGAEAGSGAFLTVIFWAATLVAISRQRINK